MFTTRRRSAGILAIAAATLVIAASSADAQAMLLRFMDRVGASDTHDKIHFVRAGYHRLEVEGDGDTDLDCWVFDRQGNVLGSDTDATDYCIVTWYQERGMPLNFRVSNLGDVYNEFEFRLQ